MNKYEKMESCKYYRALEILLDKCLCDNIEYSCDAPTDYPLWEECKDCKNWKDKNDKV